MDGSGNINMKDTDGLPLAYSLQTPEANVVFEATDIKEGGVNASAFNYSIPEGYKEVPYKQLGQIMEGM